MNEPHDWDCTILLQPDGEEYTVEATLWRTVGADEKSPNHIVISQRHLDSGWHTIVYCSEYHDPYLNTRVLLVFQQTDGTKDALEIIQVHSC